jgi:hypothetical protein
MGVHPYWYVTKYTPDPETALNELRQREFRAGRYNPVMWMPPFPVGPNSPAPGPRHATIEDALEAAAEEGTRSILDLDRVADEPDFGAATPLDDELLEELYGTARPTRAQVLGNMEFLEEVERGQGVVITLYKDGRPDEYLFAGYSYD